MHHLETLRQNILSDDEVPDTVRAFLERGAPLEEIRLDARGTWWHEGEKFLNERLSALFHRSVQRTAQGNHVLVIPPYTYPILVELTHHFIGRIDQPVGSTFGHLLDGTSSALDLRTVHTDGDTILATRTDDGRPARIVGDAWHLLIDRLDQEGPTFFLQLDDIRAPLHPLPDDFFSR